MRIRKESGGTTITHRNARYEWPEDGSVTDVPPDLAADLLGIRGGGYSEAPEPEPEGEFSEVDPGDGDGDPGDDGEEKPEKAPRKPRGKSVTES